MTKKGQIEGSGREFTETFGCALPERSEPIGLTGLLSRPMSEVLASPCLQANPLSASVLTSCSQQFNCCC